MAEGGAGVNAGGGASTVFVSYASQDAAVANAVVRALEHAGLTCWIAPRNVVPGSLYADEIVGAINESIVVVLVLSGHAISSPHVGKEIERASSKRRRIIALRTDSAPLTKAFEYFLSESQWIEVGSDGIDAATARLVEAARGHVHPSAMAELRTPVDAPIKSRALTASRPKWIALGSLTIVSVVLAYFVVDNFWGSKGVATVPPVTASAVSDMSIAVLPFADLSEAKDQGYFADGMAEEVLGLLAKIPGVKVIGRTSSFQFKGTSQDLRTIGTKLRAAYVVDGTVRRSTDRVRVTAELIDTRDGTNRWSETYDRPITDTLHVQNEIAASLTRALQVSVGADHPESRRSPKTGEAYDLYLRGRYAMDRNDEDGFVAAVAFLRQALAIDPAFADAAVALAETYYWQANNSLVASRIGYERARSAAEAALALDGSLGLAHAILGAIHTEYDRDWAAAEREFTPALRLAPRNGVVIWLAAQLPFALGQDDTARAMYKQSLAYDPLLATSYLSLSWVECRSGRLTEAEAAARKVIEIDPSFVWGHVFLGYPLLLKGDKEAALAEMERESDPKGHIDGLALVYHALGRKADADEALRRLTVEHADQSSFYIAEAHAYRGELDEALTWLDRAYLQKEPTLFLIKGDPFFRKLEGDPRYKAFLRKINLPE
jgi:TolB-like protein